MDLYSEIAENLRNGEDDEVRALTTKAIDAGLPAEEILAEALIAGMKVVGERFRKHEIFLPEVLLAARAMKAGVALLEPLFLDAGIPSLGKVVLGSARGDQHDIGKNLVSVMLQGAGFEVVDLGNDVPAERFVTAAVETGATVIGISALLTTTMAGMKAVVDLVRERGLAGDIKVVVGGAPVSKEYADEIGADAFGYDAANAVETVKGLMGAV
jgi:5-methyltetrahydrofolate--homocysteine methyltransferase